MLIDILVLAPREELPIFYGGIVDIARLENPWDWEHFPNCFVFNSKDGILECGLKYLYGSNGICS